MERLSSASGAQIAPTNYLSIQKPDATNVKIFYDLAFVGKQNLHLNHLSLKQPMIHTLNSVLFHVLNSWPKQKIYTKWLPKAKKSKTILQFVPKRETENVKAPKNF